MSHERTCLPISKKEAFFLSIRSDEECRREVEEENHIRPIQILSEV